MASKGDPQLLAAPVFVIGSIALALQLVQFVSPGALGSPIAIILGTSGLFLLVATCWAALAGQSFVACFAGTFGGFWISYGFLVLGLTHDWFKIPATDVPDTVVMFAVSFAAFFFFLTLASVRLPVIYTLIFGLVVVALIFVAAAYRATPVDLDLLKVAGYISFVFAGLGMWLAWAVMNLSLGGRAVPLGKPVRRPKGDPTPQPD